MCSLEWEWVRSLDILTFIEDFWRRTTENAVAVINMECDECVDEGFSCREGE